MIHEKSLSTTDEAYKKAYHNTQTVVSPTTLGFGDIGADTPTRPHSHVSGILSTAKGDVPK